MQLFRKLLPEFIRFKSVSTDQTYSDEIKMTADWLRKLLSENSFEVEVIEGYDNPLVVASLHVSDEYETCLIYGHYDVQPADVSEGWDSKPFELTERDGRFYARGAVDNKGQILIHICSVINLHREKKLGYNIKFLIEGNEETGSPHLNRFIEEQKDLLKADFIMISDGEVTNGTPVLESGFRGVANLTLTVRTSDRDLHSGLYGGTAPNAIEELSKLLAAIRNNKNTLEVNGVYGDVLPLDQRAVDNNKALPFDIDRFKSITGTKALLTMEGVDFHSQVGLLPSIEVTGISGGYTADGYRNSIPSTAFAKINIRSAPTQDPEKLVELFEAFIKENAPEYVECEIKNGDYCNGVELDVDDKYNQRAQQALEEVYKKEVLYKYSGGTLPIVTDFKEILGVPQVMAPLANEDCVMHGANENFKVERAEQGYAFSQLFFGKDTL